MRPPIPAPALAEVAHWLSRWQPEARVETHPTVGVMLHWPARTLIFPPEAVRRLI